MALLPAAARAQTCETRTPAAGRTDLGVVLRDAPRELAATVRHYRPRFWAGLTAGHVPAHREWASVGADATGPFVGLAEVDFVGGGAEAGYGTAFGPLGACLRGGLVLGYERSSVIAKFYTNAFGQTIGFAEEELDSDLSYRTWNLGLALDHPVAEVATVGVGAFLEQTSLFADGATGSIEQHPFVGVSGGARVHPVRWLVVHVAYRRPLERTSRSGAGALGPLPEQPDGWLVVRIAWVL